MLWRKLKSRITNSSLPFIFSSYLHRSFSLLLPALPHRDSTSQEFAIHVGTPRRGNSHRINTMYAARSAMTHNQSGIDSCPFCRVPEERRSASIALIHGASPAAFSAL